MQDHFFYVHFFLFLYVIRIIAIQTLLMVSEYNPNNESVILDHTLEQESQFHQNHHLIVL